MTPSPFAALNAATLRAERRRALIRVSADIAVVALLALTVVAGGHALLTSALALPEALARAASLKGM